MLEGLGPLGSFYHFSNISENEFEHAALELARWRDILAFDKLDVTKEPSSQGFELGSYDVVIASGIVQPSTQILANIQALVKPGGKLLMAQVPHYELDRQLVLGLLPQSWDSKSDDPNPSLLDAVSWDQFLKDAAGFSGIDVGVADCKREDARRTSTIISTVPRVDLVRLRPSDDIVIITSNKTGYPPSQWLESLRCCTAELEAVAVTPPLPDVYVLESTSAASYTGKVCIFLGEIEEPILRDMDTTTFEAVKAMSTKCKSLL